MSSFLDHEQIDSGQRTRTALPVGTYGTNHNPGLKIVSYIGSKEDRSGNVRHSFLVAALQYARGSANGNKPLDDAPEGTAFLALTLNHQWIWPPSIALAFSTDQVDLVKMAVDSKEITQTDADVAKQGFLDIARRKCLEANTPSDDMEKAMDEQYKKELTQIRIKVGTFRRLQDWKGQSFDPQLDPALLVGTEFSGNVVAGFGNAATSEVDSITQKKKQK